MLKESQSDENVTVLCPNSSGRFNISDSSVVSITGLAFNDQPLPCARDIIVG